MKDKIVLITGASSGIGKATAMGLAKLGATIVMICRNEERGVASRDEIFSESGNPLVEVLLADLSSQAEIRNAVHEFQSRYPHLNVIINNAGVAPIKRLVTTEGIEMTFAVNYLAPFLLTNLLLDCLIAGAPSRVVNVAGDFHRKATIQFDDLMFERNYNGIRANNQAKLALILFTYELARRTKAYGVTANCLHPGAVATDAPLKDPNLSRFARIMYSLVKPFFLSAEKGAETSIYLASSPAVEGITGQYFIKKTSVKSSPESYDEAESLKLWNVSLGLAGLK
jgi:NAD(P)-dependent dehydrogenase (short-subunit alcohol dehydrogenase family)